MKLKELLRLVISEPNKVLFVNRDHSDYFYAEEPLDDDIVIDIINRRGKSKPGDYYHVPYLNSPQSFYMKAYPELFKEYDNTSFIDYITKIGKFEEFLDFYVNKGAIAYCLIFDENHVSHLEADNKMYDELINQVEEINNQSQYFNDETLYYLDMRYEAVPYRLGLTKHNNDLYLIFPNHNKDGSIIKILMCFDFNNIQGPLLSTLYDYVTLIRTNNKVDIEDDKSYLNNHSNVLCSYRISGYHRKNVLKDAHIIMVNDYLSVFNNFLKDIVDALKSSNLEDDKKYVTINCEQDNRYSPKKISVSKVKDLDDF